MGNDNLLLMRPENSPNVTAEARDGQLMLVVRRTGLLSRLCTKWFHTPGATTIALDDYGSFVWQYCDGNYTVGEIAGAMREPFGCEAEPVLERLVVFLRMLANNRLVVLSKPREVEVASACR